MATVCARQLPDWIVDHMRKYVETNGKERHIWNGVPTLLPTTTGRRRIGTCLISSRRSTPREQRAVDLCTTRVIRRMREQRLEFR